MYDGYPAHILDLQIQERDKVLALGKEISRRESVLTALQQKLAEVRGERANCAVVYCMFCVSDV